MFLHLIEFYPSFYLLRFPCRSLLKVQILRVRRHVVWKPVFNCSLCLNKLIAGGMCKWQDSPTSFYGSYININFFSEIWISTQTLKQWNWCVPQYYFTYNLQNLDIQLVVKKISLKKYFSIFEISLLVVKEMLTPVSVVVERLDDFFPQINVIVLNLYITAYLICLSRSV